MKPEVASVAAAVLRLPIDYVTVKESLFAYMTFPNADSLSKLLEVDILISGAALAFVASAETLLCATAVSHMRQGGRTNYDRELAAQGLGNLLCGALGSLPISGVISRSTANVEAGAHTKWSSILHATWIFLFVVLLPGLLGLVPESALAAILIYDRALTLVERQQVDQYLKDKYIVEGSVRRAGDQVRAVDDEVVHDQEHGVTIHVNG